MGGAAVAAFRLHNAMLVSGIDSKYLVLNRTINDRVDILTVKKIEKYIIKILNMILEKITIHAMHAKGGLYSSFKYGIDISKYPEILEADVIYLHWINSFVNYHTFKRILKNRKPVFWFMHDMFAITGGCHHSFDCTNYQTVCRNCPYREKKHLSPDLSVLQYKIKKKIYKKYDNLVFIVPSKWLFECTQKSGLTQNKQAFHIPNLIDTSVFKPMSKDIARQLFSLDIKKKIIGFGADSALINHYKGWGYLKDALEILSKYDSLHDMHIEILVFGSNYSKTIADNIPFPVHFLGHLHDEYSLVMVYSCMDIFVIPSLAESFPNTILECLACDTPVVGFNVGGIPDTVNSNTGYLAEYKSSEDLAKGVSLLLKKKNPNVNEYVKSFIAEVILAKHKEMLDSECIRY